MQYVIINDIEMTVNYLIKSRFVFRCPAIRRK